MATSFARQAPLRIAAGDGPVRRPCASFVVVVAPAGVVDRACAGSRARGVNQSHALIVGTGRLARRTARTLRSVSLVRHPDRRLRRRRRRHAAAPTCPSSGPSPNLPELVEKHHIEHVFIALPLNRYADARRVFDALSQTVVDVRLIADVPALAGTVAHHHARCTA